MPVNVLQWRAGIEIFQFEKWRAIRASVCGVGGVLAWVMC